MIPSNAQATRGYGFLENFLAKKRAHKANRLIPQEARQGRILDVGCGLTPHFLMNTSFAERYGVDQTAEKEMVFSRSGMKIHIAPFNFYEGRSLPFLDGFFDTVTMLAVFEHVEPSHLPMLLNEIYRVLKPEGTFVMTTPNAWTDPLLRTMAKIGLISAIEIEDHKDVYTHKKIFSILEKTHFQGAQITAGSFELSMNLWVRVTKS